MWKLYEFVGFWIHHESSWIIMNHRASVHRESPLQGLPERSNTKSSFMASSSLVQTDLVWWFQCADSLGDSMVHGFWNVDARGSRDTAFANLHWNWEEVTRNIFVQRLRSRKNTVRWTDVLSIWFQFCTFFGFFSSVSLQNQTFCNLLLSFQSLLSWSCGWSKLLGSHNIVGRCSMLCSLKFAKTRECCGAAESRISIHMNSIPQRSWNTTLGCWAVGWAVADCDLRNRPFPLVTLNSSLNVPRFFVALRISTQIHLPAPQGQCNRTKFQREWNSCRLKPKLVFGKGHSGDHSGWFYWNQVVKVFEVPKVLIVLMSEDQWDYETLHGTSFTP